MCQILLKAFEMARNTSVSSTAGCLSKVVCISCIVGSGFAIHETFDRKPNWEDVKS